MTDQFIPPKGVSHEFWLLTNLEKTNTNMTLEGGGWKMVSCVCLDRFGYGISTTKLHDWDDHFQLCFYFCMKALMVIVV